MREFHRIVVEQPKHMRGLIGDLLDTGRIESDTLSAAPEASEMVALAEPASSTFMSTARRHAVLIDLPAGLPPVMADRRRIVQVPQQPLATRRHAAAAEGATAGRGLRLASCKGSSWRPAGASGPTAPTQAAARHSRSRSRFRRPASPKPAANPDGPPRILVVHDPLMLRFVRDALSGAGYATLLTGAPHHLPHIIRTEKARLVLLNLVLPASDGIELTHQVQQLSDLPIIFISAYRRDETAGQALQPGTADYIATPFSPTELLTRLPAAGQTEARAGAVPARSAHHRLPATPGDGGRWRVSTSPPPSTSLLRVPSLDAGPGVTFARCSARSGPSARSPMRTWSAPSPATSAASSATARPVPLHLQPARRRLPHGATGGPMSPRRRQPQQIRPGNDVNASEREPASAQSRARLTLVEPAPVRKRFRPRHREVRYHKAHCGP